MYTRHVARKSVGGKAPMKFGKRPANPYPQESKKVKPSVNITKLQDRLAKSQEIDLSSEEGIRSYVELKYERVNPLVKNWIFNDLMTRKGNQTSNDVITAETMNGLKHLDTDVKYLLLEFVPTVSSWNSHKSSRYNFTSNTNNNYDYLPNLNQIKRSNEMELGLDNQVATFCKMRLINKEFNKRMLKKLLGVTHITLNESSMRNQGKFFFELLKMQNYYLNKLKHNNRYDIDFMFLFDDSTVQYMGISNAYSGYGGSMFGSFNSYSPPFTNSIPVMIDESSSSSENDTFIIGSSLDKTLTERSLHHTPLQGISSSHDCSDMLTEKELYESVDFSFSKFQNNPVVEYNQQAIANLENYTIERITITCTSILAYPFLQFISKACKNLKILDIGAEQFVVFSDMNSASLENINISVSDIGASGISFAVMSSLIESLIYCNIPKLKTVNITNFTEYSDEDVYNYFSTLSPPDTVQFHVGRVNTSEYKQYGRDNAKKIITIRFAKPNDLSLPVIQQLHHVFNLDTLNQNGSLFGILFSGGYLDLERKKEILELAYKCYRIPMEHFAKFYLVKPLDVNSHSLLQYMIYLCEEYQDGRLPLLNNLNTIPGLLMLYCMECGWDFRKYIDQVILSSARAENASSLVLSLLDNFDISERTLTSLLLLIVSTSKIPSSAPKDCSLLNQVICWALAKNRKALNSVLVQSVPCSSAYGTVVSLPILGLIFGYCDPFFLTDFINKADDHTLQVLESYSNQRGDTILHILLLRLKKIEGHYGLLCDMIRKMPSLLNRLNAHVQSPMHLVFLRFPTDFVNQIIEEFKPDMTITDYMERTPKDVALYFSLQ